MAPFVEQTPTAINTDLASAAPSASELSPRSPGSRRRRNSRRTSCWQQHTSHSNSPVPTPRATGSLRQRSTGPGARARRSSVVIRDRSTSPVPRKRSNSITSIPDAQKRSISPSPDDAFIWRRRNAIVPVHATAEVAEALPTLLRNMRRNDVDEKYQAAQKRQDPAGLSEDASPSADSPMSLGAEAASCGMSDTSAMPSTPTFLSPRGQDDNQRRASRKSVRQSAGAMSMQVLPSWQEIEASNGVLGGNAIGGRPAEGASTRRSSIRATSQSAKAMGKMRSTSQSGSRAPSKSTTAAAQPPKRRLRWLVSA